MGDGVKLERYAGNPILAPIPGSDWESRTVFNCGVAQLDDAVVLLYRAQGMDNNVSRLGFAVSTDGFTSPGSIARCSSRSAETETWGVEDPRLTPIDGTIPHALHRLVAARHPGGDGVQPESSSPGSGTGSSSRDRTTRTPPSSPRRSAAAT